MHTVFALLCFVVVIYWLIFPYPSGLLHWHCGNLTIAPVPAKEPWWIWINTSCEFIMNDCITTTKQSTTKPCAYFLGYTVAVENWTRSKITAGENSPRIDFHGDVMMWKRLNVTGPWWEDQLLVDFSQKVQVMKAYIFSLNKLLSCWLIESPWRSCDLTVITEMAGKINVSSQICLRMGSWSECASLRVLNSWKK